MALSAVASSHGQHAGTTSLATTLPAGTQVGDLVVMVIDMNGTTTESVDQGWTELAGSPMDDGGVFLKLACWYKVLVGSDTAPTITLGTSRKIRWVQYAIRGADTTTPVLNSGPQIDSGFNGSVTPDALTNAGGATVWSLLLYGGEGSNGTVTPSSGWTSVVSEPGSDFTAYTEISDNQSPGTGTVTPGAYTYGAGHNSAVFHVLIQEAPPPVDYTQQYIPQRRSILNRAIAFGAKFGQLGLFPWEMDAGGGSPDVTVALTGVSITAAVGTLGVQHDNALTGNAATGSVGTLGVAHDQALTGNAVTGAVGTLLPALSIVPTGISVATAVGTLAPSTVVSITGVVVTGSVGNLTPGTSVVITGVAATSVAGLLAPSTTIGLVGNAVVASVGQMTASGGDPVAGATRKSVLISFTDTYRIN